MAGEGLLRFVRVFNLIVYFTCAIICLAIPKQVASFFFTFSRDSAHIFLLRCMAINLFTLSAVLLYFFYDHRAHCLSICALSIGWILLSFFERNLFHDVRWYIFLGVNLYILISNILALLCTIHEGDQPPDWSRIQNDEPLSNPLVIRSRTMTNADEAEEKEAEKKLEREAWYRLLQFGREHQFVLGMGCLLLAIRLPFSLSSAHFVSEAIRGLINREYSHSLFNILALFIAGTIDAMGDFWCVYLFGLTQARIIRDLRLRLFRAVIYQPMGWHDGTTTGEITSRLQNDTSEMANDLTWVFRFTLEAMFRLTGIVTYMLIRDWRLGLLACGIIPITAAINKLYGDWLKQNQKQVQSALAALNSVSMESIAAIRTVVGFGNEEAEYDKYNHKMKTYYNLQVKQTLMQSFYYMIVSTFLINTCVQSALLLYGVRLTRDDEIDPSLMIAFMLYQAQLQNWAQFLLNGWTNLIKSSGASLKVFQWLDQPTRDYSQTRRTQVKGDVTFAEVNFQYPTRDIQILKKVSVHIPAGKIVAFVGPSGSGKSTLFHLLENFYQPDKGRVLLDGIPVSEYSHKYLHQVVGIVGQEPELFSGKIKDNILYSSYGEELPLEAAIDAAKIANAHDFIMDLPHGYDTEVGENGVQLSGGQKQRVAIARALVQDPSVLLLDEATSALDAESELLVQNALEKAMQGRTTLIIAHRLSTIARADQIFVLHKGEIVESGTHDELMKRKRDDEGFARSYRMLVEKQTSLG